MSLVEHLQWRHAVKAYDASKKVSKENIEKIIEAVRLAPSSSGLQPFKLFVIENQAMKEKLAEGALNPDCMRNCSHVLVFAAWDNYTAERIDFMYDFITDERGLPRGRFARYTDMLKARYLDKPAEENFQHAARQTYIALGMALSQAAALKIDSTPVEGFDHQLVENVLSLHTHGLKSVVLMYVGYADKEKDWVGTMKKVRLPREQFVVEFL